MRCFLFVPLIVSFFIISTAAAYGRECQLYSKIIWMLDTKKSKIVRVGADARPISLCDPFPLSGTENIKLELLKKEKLIFKRNMYIRRQTYFDYFEKSKNKIRGGQVPSREILVMSFIPTAINLSDSELRIKISLLKNKSIMAEEHP